MDNILQAFKNQLIVERIANQTLMIIQKLFIFFDFYFSKLKESFKI